MLLFTSFIAVAALFNVALAHPHAPAITPAPVLARDDSLVPQTTSKKTTSTKKTTSSECTSKTSKTTKTTKTTSTTKKTTTTKTSHTSTITTTQPVPTAPACTELGQQILLAPTQGETFYYDPNDYNGINIEVVYCSGTYFQENSVSVDVWLGNNANGDILTLQQKPDNVDTSGGGGVWSYRFNTTVLPVEGEYTSGTQQFNVYEVSTGYEVPYVYFNNFINLNFEQKPGT